MLPPIERQSSRFSPFFDALGALSPRRLAALSPRRRQAVEDANAASDADTGWYKAHPLWACANCFFMNILFMGGLPILQGLASDLFQEKATLYFCVIGGSGTVLSAFTGPVIGALSDRYGRKPFIVFGSVAISTPAVFLCVFKLYETPQRYMAFLASASVATLFSGQVGVGMLQAYVVDCSPPHRRSAAIGLMMGVGVGLSALTSPLLLTWVHDQFGLQTFLVVFAAIGVCVPVVAILMPESLKTGVHVPTRTNPFRSLRLLCDSTSVAKLSDGRSSTGVLRVLFAVISLLYIVKQGFAFVLGLYVQQALGFSTGQAALLQTVYALFQITVQLSVSLVLKVLSKRIAIGVGVLCGICAVGIFSLPDLPSPMLYVANSLLAIASGAYVIGVSMASEVAPPGRMGEAVMVLNISMSIVSGLGPMLFAVVVELFNKTNYPNGAFLSLMCIMVLSFSFVPCLPPDSSLSGPRVKLEASSTDPVLESTEALPEEGGLAKTDDKGFLSTS